MNISIGDLPAHMQRQAEEKINAQKRGRTSGRETAKNSFKKDGQSKYNSQRTETGGIRFDSRKEAQRYEELLILLKAGEITDLKLQHTFTLQESYRDPDGFKVDAIKYIADFTYYDSAGNWIVEDVKGVRTDTYKIKKKLMAAKGYRITEV